MEVNLNQKCVWYRVINIRKISNYDDIVRYNICCKSKMFYIDKCKCWCNSPNVVPYYSVGMWCPQWWIADVRWLHWLHPAGSPFCVCFLDSRSMLKVSMFVTVSPAKCSPLCSRKKRWTFGEVSLPIPERKAWFSRPGLMI